MRVYQPWRMVSLREHSKIAGTKVARYVRCTCFQCRLNRLHIFCGRGLK